MLPTFAVDGDWLVADMTCRLGRGVSVGDLILYKIPIFSNQNGVKRIIGMPGDFVSLGTPGMAGQDKTIQVGVTQPSRPHSIMLTLAAVEVPQGHCWIVGDNLPASRDSRKFGPLPLALIQGKVVAKLLPWKEMRWIRNGLREVNDTSEVDQQLCRKG